VPLDDYTLSWAIANIPSNDWGYIPKEVAEGVEDIRWRLSARNVELRGFTGHFVLAVHRLLQGDDMEGGLVPLARAMKYDIRRIGQAIKMIDSMYAKWERGEVWDILADRVMYGIPAEMIELVRIPGVGSVRAKKLWSEGFHSPKEIVESKGKVYKIFSYKVAQKIIDGAEQLTSE